MFDYDRLSLDVAQQFSSAHNQKQRAKGNSKDKYTLSSYGGSTDSENQLFGWETPSPPLEDDNSIVNGLSELLRRCSSPGNQHKTEEAFQFQRHRSATVSSDHQHHVYSGFFSANHQPQQQRPQHKAVGNALSMDLMEQQQNRRPSGGSLGMSELFDCGASSGYGSPGAVGTPLASPAAANSAVQYIANQVHKMLMDQGFCDGLAATHGSMLHRKCAGGGAAALVHPQRMASATPAAMAQQPQPLAVTNPTPVVVRATTTTTGTNKNSNKRKTSSVTAGGGNSNITNNIGSSSPTPASENVVATDDGFDMGEIAEFAQLLSSPKRAPPPRYVCHICYSPGHYISDCPQRFNSPYEELTPYQGRKKCYGEFQCEQCKRKWTSQNSVANEAQSCIKCHIPVFPHKQLPVDKAIALGLVKIQRMPLTPNILTPVASASPPAIVSAQGQQQKAVGGGRTVGGEHSPTVMSNNNAGSLLEDAFFGLKNGHQLGLNSPALTPLAI